MSRAHAIACHSSTDLTCNGVLLSAKCLMLIDIDITIHVISFMIMNRSQR